MSKYTPTPLVDLAERKPVIITPPPVESRFRGLLLLYLVGRLLWQVPYYWVRGELTETKKGRLLAEILEGMGFLWIKIGAMMAKRVDLYSDDFRRELAAVSYREQGFPFELVQETLAQEWGRPLDEIFRELDPTPFRAATMSQTHSAVLKRSGRWVAVKVQLPGIQATFEHDMVLIRRMVGLFKWLGIQKQLRWDSIVWELHQVMIAAIDYRYEAANHRRMRKSLRRQQIEVPRVCERLTTRRVLVTEFIRGALMADVISLTRVDPMRLQSWLEENAIDLRRVGRRLSVSLLHQLMEENMVHGNLQPSNIILLRENRLAMVDLQAVTSIESAFLKRYVQSMRALANSQYGKSAELMLLLCPDLPAVDLPEVKERMVQCFRSWSARAELRRMPYAEKSLASMYRELTKIWFARNIVPGTVFLDIIHIWSTLDVSLTYLIPNSNYYELFRKYFHDASRRSFRQALRGGFVVSAITELRSTASEYQHIFGTVLRRGALVFQGGRSKLSYAMLTGFHLFCLGLLGAFFLLVMRLLYIFAGEEAPGSALSERLRRLSELVPFDDPDVLFLLILVTAYCYATVDRLRRRLRQPEVRLPGTPVVSQDS